MTAVARTCGQLLGRVATWLAVRLLSDETPRVDPDWRAMAWEARFAAVKDGPVEDVEEAFLVIVTGFFRDDCGWCE